MKTGAAPESSVSSTVTWPELSASNVSQVLSEAAPFLWTLATPELFGLTPSSPGSSFLKALLLPRVFRPWATLGTDAFLLLLQ